MSKKGSGLVTRRLALSLSGSAAIAGSTGAHASAFKESDVAEVLASFVAAMNALDLDRFAAYFAPEAVAFFPGPPHPDRKVEGQAAIAEEFQGLFDHVRARAGRLNVQPRDLSILQHGEMAVATFHLGAPERLQRRTIVLRRHESTWRIVHLHASSHPAAPTSTA